MNIEEFCTNVWGCNSVGQSIRLSSEKSRVRTPSSPPSVRCSVKVWRLYTNVSIIRTGPCCGSGVGENPAVSASFKCCSTVSVSPEMTEGWSKLIESTPVAQR